MGRFAFGLIIVALFLYVTSPLLLPVLMGGIVAVIFYPFQQWLRDRSWPHTISAAVLTFAITVLLVLPTSFFVSKLSLIHI